MVKALSFDIETNGFLGQPFAVGAVMLDLETGKIGAQLIERCQIHEPVDPWVKENVLPALDGLSIHFVFPDQLYAVFWNWMLDQRHVNQFNPAKGDVWLVDFGWPIEASFLRSCVIDKDFRERLTPYPLHDLGTLLWAAGVDPDVDRDEYSNGVEMNPDDVIFIENWLRQTSKHNPLRDAVTTGLCAVRARRALHQAEPWLTKLNEREQKEVAFCRMYAEQFNHGTPNHLLMTTVAKLAILLDSGK